MEILSNYCGIDLLGDNGVYHFMLPCTAYKEESSLSIHLDQQPYIESNGTYLDTYYFIKKN